MDHRRRPPLRVPAAPWGLRAAASGIAAITLSAALATATYRGIPGTEQLDWSRLGTAILLFALATGLCVGAGVGWGTIRAARRGDTSIRGLVAGGALGGAVAGIVPGIFGFAGFGSLHAPYLGSLNIVSSVLAGATAFVVLWAPRLLPAEIAARVPPARRFGLAALAAVITAGAAGLLGGVLAVTAGLVPSLCTLKAIASAVGLVSVGVAGGTALGLFGGALAGLCCGIFVALARATTRESA